MLIDRWGVSYLVDIEAAVSEVTFRQVAQKLRKTRGCVHAHTYNNITPGTERAAYVTVRADF